MGAPLFFSHPSSFGHDTGVHPERPQRLTAIAEELESRGWLGWQRREPPRAEIGQLLAVHSSDHVDDVRQTSARGAMFDLDTPSSPGSWEAALHAAGAGCELAEALLRGDAPCAFAAMRPPGHHAERSRAMGFCLFNNIAVAARHALDQLGAERVLVFDWDVHHGNGTNAIFRDSEEVLFASIHQYPFYPGTGALEDIGAGPGRGFSINLPVPAGSGEAEFLSLFEHVVAPAAREFDPDLVLISAGYDAHLEDPLADCLLEDGSYAELARHVRALGDEVGAPVGALLEGGYNVHALARSVAATMEALAAGGEPRSVPPTRVSDAAAEHVGRHWHLA